LLGYQSQQPFHVPLQRRRAPAAQLCSGVSCVIPAPNWFGAPADYTR